MQTIASYNVSSVVFVFSMLSLGRILISNLVVANLLMYSFPGMILLYLAVPFLHQKCFWMRLHITSYFYGEVIYYSYILLYQKSNSVILLLLSKVIILCSLVTSYWVTLKVYLWTCMQNTNFTKKTGLLWRIYRK